MVENGEIFGERKSGYAKEMHNPFYVENILFLISALLIADCSIDRVLHQTVVDNAKT